MANFTPEVCKFLSKAGWRFERYGKGDHQRWVDPATRRHVTVDAKILSRHTANAILKEAGIGKKF